jgi:hypothetical protein
LLFIFIAIFNKSKLRQIKMNQESAIFDKLEINHTPAEILNYLQSLDNRSVLKEVNLSAKNNENFWEYLCDSVDIDHLRNLLDLLTRCAPEITNSNFITKFPFDRLIELEFCDEKRKTWIVNKYLELYKKYKSCDITLQLDPNSQFDGIIKNHVQNLESSLQLQYVDYAKPEVIESNRTLAEKIAHKVRFPSQSPEFRVHCLVLGIAGVGKSTIVNVNFNEKIFDEAVGGSTLTTNFSSATRTYERSRHHKEDANTIPDPVSVEITFTDSPGPTHSFDHEEAVNSFQSFLEWTFSDPKNRPHVILYCINSLSNRISDYQYFWIISLARFFPIILVMTSSFSSKNEESWKQNHFRRDDFKKIGIKDNVFVNLRKVDESDYFIPTKGLDKLVSAISETFQANIAQYNEEQQLKITNLRKNDEGKTKLYLYIRSIWSAGVISSMTAGSIPAAWVNDAATIAAISAMLSIMTVAYGLRGIIGTTEIWELMRKSLLKVGIIQAGAIGGLVLVDQFANLIMTVPFVGTLLGSGISATCAGIAAFICGKIWWNALEQYRLEFKPGTDDPMEFLARSVEKASQEVWNEKVNIINDLNDLIRKEQISQN